MGSEGSSFKVDMDGVEVKVTQREVMDGQELTSEMKFDQYFMYGIDNMDTDGSTAPPCGPDAE